MTDFGTVPTGNLFYHYRCTIGGKSAELEFLQYHRLSSLNFVHQKKKIGHDPPKKKTPSFKSNLAALGVVSKFGLRCECELSQLGLRIQTLSGSLSRLCAFPCYVHGAVGLHVCVNVFGVTKLPQTAHDFILKTPFSCQWRLTPIPASDVGTSC